MNTITLHQRHTAIRQRTLQAILVTLVAILAGYTGVLPIFRGQLMTYLAIDDKGFGLLFSIGPLAGLVSVLFGGVFIDRWGPRRVIRLCLLGVGVSMLMVAGAGRHFGVFLAAAAVSGAFTAPLFIAISAYLAQLFPRSQRRIISLNLASSSLGGMMFPLLAEGLLSLARHSAGVAFGQVLHLPFLLAALLLFGASGMYRSPRDAQARRTTPDAATSSRLHWRDLLLPSQVFFLALLVAVHGTVDSILYLWMARFLESRSFAQQPLTPGLVLTGFSLAYLLARGLLASLPDHIGRRAFLVLPGITGGSLLIAGILSRNEMFTAISYLLGAFCWSIEYPAMVSLLLHIDQQRFGMFMAVSGLLGGLLLFAGMNGIGLLIAHVGDAQMWKVMLIPACGFLLVGLGGLAWLLRFDHGRSPATGQRRHADTYQTT